jgi:hypothetical protein
VFLNWVVPFVVLLPRPMKRSRNILPKVCVVVLFGRWLDLYLQIGAALPGYPPIPTPLEVGILMGAVGLGGWLVLHSMARAPLIPLRDPYLAESLARHEEPIQSAFPPPGQPTLVNHQASRNHVAETAVQGDHS